MSKDTVGKPQSSESGAGITEEWYESLTPENRRKWLISRCRKPSHSELEIARQRAKELGLLK